MARFLAWAAILLAVACSKTEPVVPRPVAMPAVCSKIQFDAALAAFEDVAFRRDLILARADGYPLDEPVEYLRLVTQDEEEFRELAAQAGAISVPRCLRMATQMFEDYVDRSRAALEARRPGNDPAVYREKRETADTVYAQFKAEIAQQRRNAQ